MRNACRYNMFIYSFYANAISRLQPLIRPFSYIIIELASRANMDHDLGMLKAELESSCLGDQRGCRWTLIRGLYESVLLKYSSCNDSVNSRCWMALWLPYNTVVEANQSVV
jgi:hypothetical protein